MFVFTTNVCIIKNYANNNLFEGKFFENSLEYLYADNLIDILKYIHNQLQLSNTVDMKTIQFIHHLMENDLIHAENLHYL